MRSQRDLRGEVLRHDIAPEIGPFAGFSFPTYVRPHHLRPTQRNAQRRVPSVASRIHRGKLLPFLRSRGERDRSRYPHRRALSILKDHTKQDRWQTLSRQFRWSKSTAVNFPLMVVVKNSTSPATAIPEATGSPESYVLPSAAFEYSTFDRSCRQCSTKVFGAIAVTRPPEGANVADILDREMPSPGQSIPFAYTRFPSNAQPVCSPPMILGKAKIRSWTQAVMSAIGGPR